MKKLNPIKLIDELDHIAVDMVEFDKMLIVRFDNSIVALSTFDYSVLWKTELQGRTMVSLDTIDICKNTIIVFSYCNQTDLFIIYGIDKQGTIIWKTETNSRPIENKSKTNYNNQLYFVGANSEKVGLFSINPESGLLNLIQPISLLGCTFLTTIGTKLILAGYDGMFYFTEEDFIKIFSDCVEDLFCINKQTIIMSIENGNRTFSKFRLISTIFELEKLTTIYLDSSNKDFMKPLIIDNKIIKIKGKCRHLECYDVNTKALLWSTQNKNLNFREILYFSNQFFIAKVEDEHYKSTLYLCSAESGKLEMAVNYKNPLNVFKIKDSLFSSGSNKGLGVYKLNNE